MKTQRIIKSAEITVNLGNYENIRLHSGIECDVSYDSAEELKAIEEQKWHEVAEDIRTALVSTLNDLKKTTDAPEKFADSCGAKASSL